VTIQQAGHAGPGAPGTATRDFLRASDEFVVQPVDWSIAPARYKRYPGAARLALDEADWHGELLWGLLGLTRLAWVHPHDETGRPEPGMVLALTAVFWRSGVRYGDLAYKLQCQEAGALTAHALALAQRLGLDVTVHLGFNGVEADRLLGLDPAAESCLGILALSRRGARLAASRDGHDAPGGQQAPVGGSAGRPAHSPPQVTASLPYLMALHDATRRAPVGRARADRERGGLSPVPPLLPVPATIGLPAATRVPAAEGASRRASPLNGYRPAPLSAADLARILLTATAGYSGDLPGTATGPQATALYVATLSVAGIPAGVFRYLPGRHALGEVGGQDMVGSMAVGPLCANTRAALWTCAAVLIPVGDPLAGARRFGDLWYRLQQAEAGLVVHRAALAAAALGLAARIHSDGANPTTDTALGLGAGPWRSLSFLPIGTPRTSGPARTASAWLGTANRPGRHPGNPGQEEGNHTCPLSLQC
jgi:hypothetical protein